MIVPESLSLGPWPEAPSSFYSVACGNVLPDIYLCVFPHYNCTIPLLWDPEFSIKIHLKTKFHVYISIAYWDLACLFIFVLFILFYICISFLYGV